MPIVVRGGPGGLRIEDRASVRVRLGPLSWALLVLTLGFAVLLTVVLVRGVWPFAGTSPASKALAESVGTPALVQLSTREEESPSGSTPAAPSVEPYEVGSAGQALPSGQELKRDEPYVAAPEPPPESLARPTNEDIQEVKGLLESLPAASEKGLAEDQFGRDELLLARESGLDSERTALLAATVERFRSGVSELAAEIGAGAGTIGPTEERARARTRVLTDLARTYRDAVAELQSVGVGAASLSRAPLGAHLSLATVQELAGVEALLTQP